jgi:hypothetical protein
VVEELSADGADHALDVRVLPGRARGCENLGGANGLHPSAKLGAIDAVAIAQQVAGRRIIGERLDHLCRAVQVAVGEFVTLKSTTRRRRCNRTTKT